MFKASNITGGCLGQLSWAPKVLRKEAQIEPNSKVSPSQTSQWGGGGGLEEQENPLRVTRGASFQGRRKYGLFILIPNTHYFYTQRIDKEYKLNIWVALEYQQVKCQKMNQMQFFPAHQTSLLPISGYSLELPHRI